MRPTLERQLFPPVHKPVLALGVALFSAALLQACSAGSPNTAAAPAAMAVAANSEASTAEALEASVKAAAAGGVAVPIQPAGVPDASFSSFESAHVHPLDITPDGTKLLAVNTPNNDLEIFAVSGSSLTLQSVVKVGLEPVTVRALSSTQA